MTDTPIKPKGYLHVRRTRGVFAFGCLVCIRVWVDGRQVASLAEDDVARIPLDCGRHEVGVRAILLRSHSASVEIVAGHTLTLTCGFHPNVLLFPLAPVTYWLPGWWLKLWRDDLATDTNGTRTCETTHER